MAKRNSSAELTTDQLLDLAGQVATKVKPKSGKQGAPIVFIEKQDEKLYKAVSSLVPLLIINSELKSVVEAEKEDALTLCLRKWVAQVWKDRQVPDNPRIAIRKGTSDVIDMSFVFQVKHNSKGIDLPENLKPGQTVQDIILYALTSNVVGLTAAKASEVVKTEIEVKQEYFMPDFAGMLKSKDEEIRSGADKIFRFVMGLPMPGVVVTPEERKKILQQRQLVRVDDGFIERSFTYCDSEEQLYKLLKYMGVSLVASNPDFAEGDKRPDRNARLQKVVGDVLGKPLPKS